MKRFILKTIAASSPIILIGIFAELLISFYPNTFNVKSNYLNSNLDNIECLFLGSSHTQNGVNPAFIDISSANVAYGGQCYRLDSAIFFKNIDQLKKLKKVCIEIDYHSLGNNHNADYFRLPWYFKYYDINLGNFKAYDKMSLFFSNPTFFKNYLVNKLNPSGKKEILNEFGFIVNDSGLFEELKFNKINILKDAKARLNYVNTPFSETIFESNKIRVLSIINYCIQNNIEVIILKNPVYITYQNNYIKETNNRRMVFLDSLISTNKIKIIDFESDINFSVKDFKNHDHLNSEGAEKLSKLINDELNR